MNIRIANLPTSVRKPFCQIVFFVRVVLIEYIQLHYSIEIRGKLGAYCKLHSGDLMVGRNGLMQYLSCGLHPHLQVLYRHHYQVDILANCSYMRVNPGILILFPTSV